VLAAAEARVAAAKADVDQCVPDTARRLSVDLAVGLHDMPVGEVRRLTRRHRPNDGRDTGRRR
jgi:hypothetical protein